MFFYMLLTTILKSSGVERGNNVCKSNVCIELQSTSPSFHWLYAIDAAFVAALELTLPYLPPTMYSESCTVRQTALKLWNKLLVVK